MIPRADVDREAVMEADQVLVGRNKTRVDDNDRLRELKGLPRHEPVVGDRLAGFTNHLPAYRFESAEPAIWLESLYVVPDFRRAGVARALMAAVASDALARDVAAIYWGVRMVNDGGKGFYHSIDAQSEKAEILALFRDQIAALTT